MSEHYSNRLKKKVAVTNWLCVFVHIQPLDRTAQFIRERINVCPSDLSVLRARSGINRKGSCQFFKAASAFQGRVDSIGVFCRTAKNLRKRIIDRYSKTDYGLHVISCRYRSIVDNSRQETPLFYSCCSLSIPIRISNPFGNIYFIGIAVLQNMQ